MFIFYHSFENESLTTSFNTVKNILDFFQTGYDRPSHLQVAVHQSTTGRFICPQCSTSFTRKDNLRNHLKFQCGQQPRFNCPYCDYRTKHSPNVRTHVRRLHPDRKIFVVDVLLGLLLSPNYHCPRDWDRVHVLDIEEMLAPNNIRRRRRRGRPSSSNYCLTRADNGQFPCPNCPSSFSYGRGLQQHLKYACCQRPRFKCPYCQYKSKYRYNAYNHVRHTHKDQQVYCIELQDEE
ncbi:hypothetical protein TSAR_011804 [Trichomalopsis sarcophagae]|uniref:C2H2-type domain-containing protein n=1 Tax=Trichomalopsis sarcophagae TaxID=543379 RepID=A0A232F635_9HYME|nr:hypothetical protein TSAR_011804 [Trichomalopsis sarcophagae]